MAESAALLVDEVFPEQPVRQWVLSFPNPLRLLFATRPAVMGLGLGGFHQVDDRFQHLCRVRNYVELWAGVARKPLF